jgi:transcription-repair coupling factor (superfamily II helicase)
VTAPLEALAAVWRDRQPIDIPGHLVVPAPLRALFLAGLATRANGPVLALVPGERDAEDLADDVELFVSDSFFLPAWETLPFEHVSPNVGTMAARAAARHALRTGGAGVVVVASVRAAIQRVSPSPTDPVVLSVGDEVDFDSLVNRLAEAGYDRTDRVETRGEFAVRGGIIDLYPAQGREPVRIDFWGDRVEEITTVSVTTQRSAEKLPLVTAFPAREVRPGPELAERARALVEREPWAASTWDRIAQGASFPGIESWLPWLADEVSAIDEARSTVVLFEPPRAHDRALDLTREETELAVVLAPTWGTGAPEAGEHPDLFLPLDAALPPDRLLEAPAIAARPGEEALTIGGFDAEPGNPESVAAGIGRLVAKGIRVVVAMDGEGPADRVARVLAEEGLVLPRDPG